MSTEPKTILELKNVNIRFSKASKCLYKKEGVSFKLKEGQKMVLAGPSGVGKSMLFEHLAGLKVYGATYKGDIKIKTPFEVLYTQNYLDKSRSIRENFEGYYLNFNYKYDLQRIAKFIFKQEEASLNRLVSSLSWGTQRRIAMYRIYMQESVNLLLLDEPTTGFDKQRIKQLCNMIRLDSRAYIIVTHDELLSSIADQILVFSPRHHCLLTKKEAFGIVCFSYKNLVNHNSYFRSFLKHLKVVYFNERQNKIICKINPEPYKEYLRTIAEAPDELLKGIRLGFKKAKEPLNLFLDYYYN